MLDPAPCLTQLFCFLLGVDSLHNTQAEASILHVCTQGHLAFQVYKPKPQAGVLYRSANLYTEAQLHAMEHALGDHLAFFDYVRNEDGGA